MQKSTSFSRHIFKQQSSEGDRGLKPRHPTAKQNLGVLLHVPPRTELALGLHLLGAVLPYLAERHVAAAQVLLRPALTMRAVPGLGLAHEIGAPEERARQRHEIGAAGMDERIDLARLGHAAHEDRRHLGHVPDRL